MMASSVTGLALTTPTRGVFPFSQTHLGTTRQGWHRAGNTQTGFAKVCLPQSRTSVRLATIQAKFSRETLQASKPWEAGSIGSEDGPLENLEKQDQPRQSVGWQKMLTDLRSKALPAVAALVVAGACLAPMADAADALKVCTCLVKECRAEFVRCLGDPGCAANIACLQSCNGRPDETECQIGCGDLFQNAVVDEFNACAVSRKGCVPQKPDENLYPIPPSSALVPDFKVASLEGTWFISSGLNPIFDVFDCQEHKFKANGNTFEADLTWRISTPDGGFFKRSAVQNFVQDPNQPALLFNHDNEFLHYQDDWYVLDAQMENKPDDFFLVYYRGKNDAWDGYGGAVVYTRARTLPESIIPRLREATAKVNLDFDKQFRTTDNTCGPQLPLFMRLEKKAEKVLMDTERAVEEVERRVEFVGRKEIELLQNLIKGLTEVGKDEARFLQGLSKEEREFFDSLDMSPAEMEKTFDRVSIRRFR